MQHLTAQPALSNSSVRCNSWIGKRYHVAAARRRQTSTGRAKPHRPWEAVGGRVRPCQAVSGRVKPWEAAGGREYHLESNSLLSNVRCTCLKNTVNCEAQAGGYSSDDEEPTGCPCLWHPVAIEERASRVRRRRAERHHSSFLSLVLVPRDW